MRMKIRLEFFKPYAFARAYNVNWYAGRNLSNLLGRFCRVARKVCLVGHNDRTGAATVDQFKKALQASQIKVAIEPHHYKDNVDVRRQQLRALFIGCLAYKRARTRQHALDGGWPVTCGRSEGDKVTDSRKIRALRCKIAEGSTRLRGDLAFAGSDLVVSAMLPYNSARQKTLAGILCSFPLLALSPSKCC